MFLDEPQAVPAPREFDLFAGVGFDGQKKPDGTDEFDNLLMFTAKADLFVSDVLGWWKRHSGRFPHLSILARDTLMIQRSSVASKTAFSKAGGYNRADRSKLSDENIEMMIKLKSWNRLSAEP